jgi:cleavage stimulation factor subunit 1
MASSTSKSDLYTLIIAQLLEDGFDDAAALVGNLVQIATLNAPGERALPRRVPRHRLATLVDMGLLHEQQLSGVAERVTIFSPSLFAGLGGAGGAAAASSAGGADTQMAADAADGADGAPSERLFRAVLPSIDLDQSDASDEPVRADYTSVFVANHKASVLCAAFSADGLYLCTGAADCSVKLLDVHKMKQVGINDAAAAQARPTLRSFYDHLEPVNDVAIHPHSTILASCSDDCTVRLFDLMAPGSTRRAFRMFSDVARYLSVSFHPTGDFLLASTTGRVVRLYDVASGACYKSRDDAAQHASGVLQASWALDGKLYATAGEDGDAKLWDGVSQRLVHALPRLNNGVPIVSARFSRGSRYLLATGADGVASLIDVRTYKLLRRVGSVDASHGAPVRLTQNRGASFSCDERMIVLPNPHSLTVSLYSTRDGRALDQLRGHNAPVNAVVASPTEPLLVTAGADSRARLWHSGKST